MTIGDIPTRGGRCLSQPSESSPAPRVCMPTWRGFARMPFQCNRYEAQDVLCGLDTVDLLALEPGPGFCFRERWLRKLIWKDMTRQLVYANPGLRPVQLTKDRKSTRLNSSHRCISYAV